MKNDTQPLPKPHKKLAISVFAIVLIIGAILVLVVVLAWPLLYNSLNQALTKNNNDLMSQASSEDANRLFTEEQKIAKDLARKPKVTASPSKSPSTSPSVSPTPSTTKTPTSSRTPTSKPKPTPTTTPAPSVESVTYMSGSKLPIPARATVLTLSGLNFNLYNDMPNKLQGVFNKAPYYMVKVDYPASTARDSISKGVANLDAALKGIQGKKIVLAQSQGAQVVSRWIREHANDRKAPSTNDLTFILTGNPLRSTGGYIIGRPEVGGTTGQPTPTNSRWNVIDVARRYDGWADWVKDESNEWAVKNANAGKTLLHKGYNDVNINDPSHTVWKSGSTTYVLTQEKILPMWDEPWWYPSSVISTMKAHIESAYHRPVNDPPTTVVPTSSLYWNTVMKLWGIKS